MLSILPFPRPIEFRWLTAISLVLVIGAAKAVTVEGRVVGISDGDTITILDAAHQQQKIRLDGIDAPEKEQAFG